jgi:hypothetical protein
MRTIAIRSMVHHFEHKLFLSATPHNGYRESFAALLELLDSQRFARTLTPDRTQLDAVMVRRMKSELKLRWDGSRRFAERIVKHLEVPYTDEERRSHQLLQEYSKLAASLRSCQWRGRAAPASSPVPVRISPATPSPCPRRLVVLDRPQRLAHRRRPSLRAVPSSSHPGPASHT